MAGDYLDTLPGRRALKKITDTLENSSIVYPPKLQGVPDLLKQIDELAGSMRTNKGKRIQMLCDQAMELFEMPV